MVEYLRLIRSDSLTKLAHNWQGPQALTVAVIAIAVIALMFLVVRRK